MSEYKVKIKTAEIVKCLKDNLAKHKEEFEEAKAQYFIQLRAELQQMMEDALQGKSRVYATMLRAPIDNTKQYQKHIGYFSMAVDELIELDIEEYDSFVNDEWGWAVSAKMLNSTYSTSR